MPLSPSGQPVSDSYDRIMLLMEWALHIKDSAGNLPQDLTEQKANNLPMIIAGIGKPTFPVNPAIAIALTEYGLKVFIRYLKAQEQIDKKNALTVSAVNNEIIKTIFTFTQTFNNLIAVSGCSIKPAFDIPSRTEVAAGTNDEPSGAIGYADPKGDACPKKIMADALTEWYDHTITIASEHVLFTVGEANGLYAIFKALNLHKPKGRIVTPNPYYSLYQGPDGENNLAFIDVMQNQGYKLTAQSVQQCIQELESKGEEISAFLFCDPNNPLGTVVGYEEWKKIAVVLEKYLETHPETFVILDEAYTGMQHDQSKGTSLLQVINSKFHKNFAVLRSATKGNSAAGDRYAVAIIFSEELMTRVVAQTIATTGHAPRSAQIVYAKAMQAQMKNMADKDRDKGARSYHAEGIAFYREQVEFVMQRLQDIKATMPDEDYKPEATFYVMADFSDLLGTPFPAAAQQALGKKTTIETDEDIAYALLFRDKLMICPGSYYGLPKEKGYMRITCSGGIEELIELMRRLEVRLTEARKLKQTALVPEWPNLQVSQVRNEAKNTDTKETSHRGQSNFLTAPSSLCSGRTPQGSPRKINTDPTVVVMSDPKLEAVQAAIYHLSQTQQKQFDQLSRAVLILAQKQQSSESNTDLFFKAMGYFFKQICTLIYSVITYGTCSFSKLLSNSSPIFGLKKEATNQSMLLQETVEQRDLEYGVLPSHTSTPVSLRSS